MPVLFTTGHIAPKSALRYRPIADKAAQTGLPLVQRASRVRPRPMDTEDEVAEWQRVEDEDAYAGSAAARQTIAPSGGVPGASHIKGKLDLGRRVHPLLYLGLGMIAMLTLWTLLTLAVTWWTTTMDDIHYGRPRTFQMDAYVGHNETGTPSHFIALKATGQPHNGHDLASADTGFLQSGQAISAMLRLLLSSLARRSHYHNKTYLF